MAYVIQASPISKVFIPELHRKCLETPALVLDDKFPFTLTVPRSAGAIVLEHNKPVHSSQLIPHTGTREIDTDEVRNVLPWLTGGKDNNETDTDIYGVVLLELDDDMTAGISEIVSIEALALENEKEQEVFLKKQQQKLREMIAQMKSAIIKARIRADERVKRALRVTHSNIKMQWDRIEQEGGRPYDASVAEALGAFVLQQEIAHQTEDQAKIRGLVQSALARPQVR